MNHVFLRVAVGFAGLLCLVIAGCGGGSATDPAGDLQTVQLYWPPPAAERGVSAASSLNGAAFTDKNPLSAVNDTQLTLNPEAGHPMGWGIYTFPALPTGADLTQVDVSAGFSGTGDAGVFIGLANYDEGAWEWFPTANGSLSQAITSSSTYLSPSRSPSIAVVYWGDASATVHLIAIETTAPALEPPAGLAGDASLNQVDLSWEEVTDATGYLVERSFASGFSPSEFLTATAISTTTYSDTNPGTDRMCYYRVRAVNDGGQSSPCDPIDIHVPQGSLPMPTNFRVTQTGLDALRVAWDYDGTMPSNFEVLMAYQPDAALGARVAFTPGFIEYANIESLQPDTTYYLRVVAIDGHGWRGVATDDLEAKTKSPWDWETPVAVGNGSGPIAMCQTPSGVAAAYNSGGGITVAENSGSGWTTSNAISGAVTEDSIDIDCADDGVLCVVIHSKDTDDLWASVGSSGSWNAIRVDGDGTTGQFRDKSGFRCRVAAGPSEFTVVHYSQEVYDFLVHKSSSTAVSWDVNTLVAGNEASCDVYYVGSTPYASYYDSAVNQLKLASRDDSWTFSQALSSTYDGVGESFNLNMFGTSWWIPAGSSDDNVYMVSGGDTPFSADLIGDINEAGVFYTNVIEIDGAQAFGGYRSTIGWQFIDNASGWVIQEIDIPSATLGPGLGLGVMNNLPIIVFEDTATSSIKSAVGIPPQ